MTPEQQAIVEQSKNYNPYISYDHLYREDPFRHMVIYEPVDLVPNPNVSMNVSTTSTVFSHPRRKSYNP